MPYKNKEDYKRWREKRCRCSVCEREMKNKSRYEHKRRYCQLYKHLDFFIEELLVDTMAHIFSNSIEFLECGDGR